MVRTRNQRRKQNWPSLPPESAASNAEAIDVPSSPEENDVVTPPRLPKRVPLQKANGSTSKSPLLENARKKYVPLQKANGSTSKSPLSENARKKYAAAVKLVKEALVNDLTTGNNQDVDSLFEIANKAFTSLDGLQADYGDLLKAVHDFILKKMRASHCESGVVEAKKALGAILPQEDEIDAKVEFLKREQESIDISLSGASKKMNRLRKRISETEKQICSLKKLEQEMAVEDIGINQLKQEWTGVEASRAYLKAVKEKIAKEAETAGITMADAYRRRGEAVAELEMAKTELLNCLS
ncbi:hypothetical protein CCACVL1_13618 [Corchorus capsularis]|uniref:Uncharacterized protein n=1 Tax=Corchorus capsularis TaxID=210143 RepID=A0A1R3IAC9_COCAP|nr:hypothetical protein CCACVL1_13618 [Corchorus capsularis]